MSEVLPSHLGQSDLGDVQFGPLDEIEQEIQRPLVDR
jgi:hypothetical protein